MIKTKYLSINNAHAWYDKCVEGNLNQEDEEDEGRRRREGKMKRRGEGGGGRGGERRRKWGLRGDR